MLREHPPNASSLALTTLSVLSLTLTCAGCAHLNSASDEAQVEEPIGSTSREIIVSSAMDGEAGVIIGKEMDEHAEEIDEDLDEATVTKVASPETEQTAGFVIVFGSAHFGVDSDELLPSAFREMDEIARDLGEHPMADVVIVGHTDATGPAAYNQRLAEHRASSAASYLRKRGVAPTRLTLLSKGESDPIAPNETRRGRQKNRRVEMAVYASEERRAKAARQARSG